MRFVSTRGLAPALGFSDAVATGLAPDGGLYLPETLPDLAPDLPRLARLDYPGLCLDFLARFATDVPAAVLRDLVAASHARFTHPEIAAVGRTEEQLVAEGTAYKKGEIPGSRAV